MKKRNRKTGSAVEPLVATAELAEAWKCHPTTVARVLRRYGLEPVTLTHSRNGLKRWRLTDVERFLREEAGL